MQGIEHSMQGTRGRSCKHEPNIDPVLKTPS